MRRRRKPKPEIGRDYFWENGRFVFTREYLLSLGECCENDCPHCPYKCDLPLPDELEYAGANGSGARQHR
jgi:hypothetical protein